MAKPAQRMVEVVGLKALAADVKKQSDDVQSDLYKALRSAGKAAAEPIAAATRSALPYDSGHLAGTVRASGTRTGASVREGSKKYPYAGWIDFGGDREPQGGHRDRYRDGRYLFPNARNLAATAARTYEDEIAKVFGADRIWTNVTTSGEDVHD